MRQWKILHSEPLTHQVSSDEIVRILLGRRGVTDEMAVQAFLHPSLDQVTIKAAGISRSAVGGAIRRIRSAISAKEPITIYTDYDVDGVCAGAMIWETLHGLGADILPYIPHRQREGYGLSRSGIEQIHREHRTSLLITADHGITAVEQIAYAKSLGMDTIVLDHHIMPNILPEVTALVHTTKLCAAGIAWLFSREVIRQLGKPGFRADTADLDLAALATVADLVPLAGINRVLVAYGLDELRRTKRIGLQAMIAEADIDKENIDVYTIGHILAPRINAMGRVTHAMDALRLLCTRDMVRAKQLARLLESTNRERQNMTEEATANALEIARKQFESGAKLLFVHSPSYPQGIIGLVAGRLTQEFYRPAIVVSEGKEYSKASARSIAGCNIVEMIRTAADMLESVGGHPMAAGFTISTKRLSALSDHLSRQMSAWTDDALTPTLTVDAVISSDRVTESFADAVGLLSPFGIGNPQPVFASMRARLTGMKQVGNDGKHLKCAVSKSDGNSIDAIGFGMGHLFETIARSQPTDIAYAVERNTWNGQSRLQLKLRDIKIPQ